MDKKDSEFLKRIQATFRIEAEEHIQNFSTGLTELEKTSAKERIANIIEVLFREIHSLKGAARSIDRKEVEAVCSPLENLLSALKRREVSLSPLLFDTLYKTVRILSELISSDNLEQSSADRHVQKGIIQQLKSILEDPLNFPGTPEPNKSDGIQPIETITTSSPASDIVSNKTRISGKVNIGVVRIPISKLDPVLLQAEEMIQTKVAFDQRIKELKEINYVISDWKVDLLECSGDRTSISSGLWNESVEANMTYLNKLQNLISELTHSMERDHYNLDRMVIDHLGEMKQLLMLPVSSLVESFPAMIREISHEQKKEIEFIIQGADLEIDKRILEDFKDPLIHLIRNSLDHGITTPNERISNNKPPHGTIILAFTALASGIIEITLSDDGKGINKEQVLKSAIKSGIISFDAAEKLDPQEILSLIYHSGVTTSSIITDISGRGLGLSIVREKVEKLNGKIFVDTKENVGTTFRILLPMTLATFRGILISIDEFMFILPTANVEQVIRVEHGEIKTVKNHETIQFDDKVISVVDMGEVLGLPVHGQVASGKMARGSEILGKIRLVILISGDDRVAFKVGDVIGEQQVLVKGLGKLLKRIKNISGATILGSGKVIPVLHISDLMKSALKSSEVAKNHGSTQKTTDEIKKILVAEDSITARTLIKNILETAGYNVTTAVDGIDAFTRAHTDQFDLVVSDVDMPRMNGFELTAKIRNDKKLSEVPVVLLTALESREDRERGVEVGADAYIIKSSFDQSNLLEVINKLI